jgi:prepilin-type N-terminal cleavage/methylation domain-containing protein
MNKQKQAFTLVELIVVITILAILWTIAFISLQWYSKDARDSIRISDTSNMKTSLELFHLDSGKYPLPDDYWTFTYWWNDLFYQWYFWDSVVQGLSRNITEVPLDPLTAKKYIYSVANNKNELEILSLLEWDSLTLNTLLQTNAASIVVLPKITWNYNSLFIKTVDNIVPIPSIITSEELASGASNILTQARLESIIINWWENIPNNWNVVSNTWALTWLVLTSALNNLDKDSTDADKAAVVEVIKSAYVWETSLSNEWIYEYILNATVDNTTLAGIFETLVLGETIVTNSVSVSVSKTVADCSALANAWDVIYGTTDWLSDWADILTCDDDIIICDGTWEWNWIIIQACNHWAITVFTNQPFVSATTARDSGVNEWAGWLYQWWNNEDVSYVTPDTNQIPISDINSTYNGNGTFIRDTGDWNTTPNDDLWWYNWWTWTNTQMKWPCEAWYHVPSQIEWANLVNLKWDASDANLWTSMGDDLKMPMWGSRHWNDATIVNQEIYWYHWASWPKAAEAYTMNFGPTYINPTWGDARASGLSVRCFKN